VTVSDTKGSDVSSQQGPQGVLEGLAAVARHLEDAGWRERFAQDADAALRDAGIAAGTIPAQTLEILRGCSADQLAAISKVGKSLENEGMSVEAPGEFGRVFFF
jgi:hypothetical protein